MGLENFDKGVGESDAADGSAERSRDARDETNDSVDYDLDAVAPSLVANENDDSKRPVQRLETTDLGKEGLRTDKRIESSKDAIHEKLHADRHAEREIEQGSHTRDEKLDKLMEHKKDIQHREKEAIKDTTADAAFPETERREKLKQDLDRYGAAGEHRENKDETGIDRFYQEYLLALSEKKPEDRERKIAQVKRKLTEAVGPGKAEEVFRATRERSIAKCSEVPDQLIRSLCVAKLNAWLKYPGLHDSSYFGTRR